MPHDDEYSAHTDRRYASLDDSVIPDAENLKVTLERALPFWEDKIMHLKMVKRIRRSSR